MVDALYVDARGIYPRLLGAEHCWDEQRDARTYDGPGPVVAHPPCGRWCGLAKLNERRWGAKVGEDGGCFEAAMRALATYGGVLEHPAFSLAWPAFALDRPAFGRWTHAGDAWVTEVHQVAYGHKARKRTWLIYVGARAPFALDWSSPKPTHQIGGGVHTGNRNLPRLNEGTHATPELFARELIRLAEWSHNA